MTKETKWAKHCKKCDRIVREENKSGFCSACLIRMNTKKNQRKSRYRDECSIIKKKNREIKK